MKNENEMKMEREIWVIKKRKTDKLSRKGEEGEGGVERKRREREGEVVLTERQRLRFSTPVRGQQQQHHVALCPLTGPPHTHSLFATASIQKSFKKIQESN